MKYFLCPEDPDCIPVIEAENIDEAKKEMCTACIEASPEDFECDGPLEVTDGSEIEKIKKNIRGRRGVVMDKPILDPCCGSKMFWFDKNNPHVEFCDIRTVPYHEYYPQRYIEINPDTVCDFTSLPFQDKSFKLVVFDPPHLTWAGPSSYMRLKYGHLNDNWPEMLHDGFNECMRVLDDYGTLIFKWSEVQIPLKEVLKAIKYKPLFGHRSGKHYNTHWMAFMKFPKEAKDDGK